MKILKCIKKRRENHYSLSSKVFEIDETSVSSHEVSDEISFFRI